MMLGKILPPKWFWQCLLLVTLGMCGIARAQEQSPAALLNARGLSASGSVWISAAEARLRKQIESLESLQKRCQQTAQRVEILLQQNEMIRARLVQLEAAQKTSPGTALQPPAGSSAKTAESGSKASAPAVLDSRMPDVTGLGELSPLQVALVEAVNARNTLAIAVLRLQKQSGELERQYARLRAEPDVARAIAVSGAGQRLGPIKDYQQILLAAEKWYATARVPIYMESGRQRVSAILNEQTPATFSYADERQPTLITASLGQTLGVSPAEGATPQTYQAGNRKLDVRPVKLPSLRIGKFVIRETPALLLPPEAEDLGSQLSASALRAYRVRIDPHRMSLELSPLVDDSRYTLPRR